LRGEVTCSLSQPRTIARLGPTDPHVHAYIVRWRRSRGSGRSLFFQHEDHSPRSSRATQPGVRGRRRGLSESGVEDSRVPALGPRGEGWVALQTVALGGAIACAVVGPRWPHAVEPELRISGYVIEAAGLALTIAARFALGASFTLLPRPRQHATLRRHGVYALARHPIYGGLLLIAIGLALHRSGLVFLPTALLVVVFLLKSMREEAWLSVRYPDYHDYRQATRHRFVPWLV